MALGCDHAEVRVERIRSQVVQLRDAKLEMSVDNIEIGIGLRVVHEGSIGFAATVDLGAEAAVVWPTTPSRWQRQRPPQFRVEWSSPPSPGLAKLHGIGVRDRPDGGGFERQT